MKDALVAVITYRIISLLVGFGFGFMGYRLFVLGVYGSTDMKTVWGSRTLLLRRAAPGTLFALFGAILVTASVLRGFELVVEPVSKSGERLEVQDASKQRNIENGSRPRSLGSTKGASDQQNLAGESTLLENATETEDGPPNSAPEATNEEAGGLNEARFRRLEEFLGISDLGIYGKYDYQKDGIYDYHKDMPPYDYQREPEPLRLRIRGSLFGGVEETVLADQLLEEESGSI